MLHLLKRRSFGAMTLCQFLGAFNDNAFKMVVLFLVTATAATETAAGGLPAWVESSFLASLGQALPTTLFALPFVIFGPITGAFADRLSKSLIIKFANLLEIMVMGGATLAFAFASYDGLMLVMFMMGTQSAIFGPSKYGVIKELVGAKDLGPANALIQSSTMIAILGGNVVGGWFAEYLEGQLWMAGIWYMGFATLGWIVSLRIEKLPAADAGRDLSWNPWVEFRNHWRATDGNVHLIRAIYASAFFYLMATIFVMVVIAYGVQTLGLEKTQVSLLNAFTIFGIVGGAMLAGRLSKGRTEGGLIPLGLILMAVSVLLVQLAPSSANLVRLSLFGMGFGSGLFTIPIRCLIQGLPAEEHRGGVQGLAETMDFVGILLGGGVFYIYDKVWELTPPQMFLVSGLVVAGFAALTLMLTVEFAVRLVLLIFTNTIYRLRTRGVGHVPSSGGALLVSNHVTFVDAILIAAASPRPVRFLMYRDFFDIFGVGWFARKMRAIPVSSADSSREKLAALRTAAQAAADGEIVCIFAEGSITRTGSMLPFARGLERIAKRAGVPIVPVGLDRLWGSIFSYEGGRFLWKRPHRLPYPVDLLFGTPLPADTPAHEVRNHIQELIAQARTERSQARGSLAWRFVKSAKVNARHTAVVDGSGARTSYRKLLISSL
ncbi:MAG: MFS transporter, partial [Planctomycetota bacterium]